MNFYYSPSNNAFYPEQFEQEGIGTTLPPDAIKIPEKHYIELFNNQCKGMIICADEKGYPINKKAPPLDKRLVDQTEKAKKESESHIRKIIQEEIFNALEKWKETNA